MEHTSLKIICYSRFSTCRSVPLSTIPWQHLPISSVLPHRDVRRLGIYRAGHSVECGRWQTDRNLVYSVAGTRTTMLINSFNKQSDESLSSVTCNIQVLIVTHGMYSLWGHGAWEIGLQ